MQKLDPLIRTKLHLPFTRRGLVSRPRLQELIAQGLYGPLTLVTAPAGFGKTTLVAACVAGCGMPVAWLSLDKNDNQIEHFLRYLISALQEAENTIGSQAVQMLGVSQPAQPEVILTSLINDLERAEKDLVLVLDDYQFISSQAVQEAMNFLLEHCPHTLHLVIATRSDPRLPLARMRARGQAVEVRADDLRFTEAEAAQFLNDVMSLRLDARSVAVLEERTEGWIAGLQMAAITIQSALFMQDRKEVLDFIEGFSGTNRYILDYLLEEVLGSQPPEIQRFLLFTSILERLTAPLCDAVLAEDEVIIGQGDPRSTPMLPLKGPSASILEHLERANLFLVHLDHERQWFRYHHLFADLLKVRLHQEQPEIVSHLHIRASSWFEKKGFILEAIQHLFAAHETGRAADLIEPYGHTRWVANDPSVLQMADGLPREILLARPKLGLYLAWLLICQGHVQRVVPLLNDLDQHLAQVEANPPLQWVRIVISLALTFLGSTAAIQTLNPFPGEQVLDEIPAEEVILRDAAEILYGMALARRGETVRATEVSARCIQREKTIHGMQAVPTLVFFLARLYLIQGRLHLAHSLCCEYLDLVKEKGMRMSSSAGSLEIVLGEVLYEWNCLDEGEKYLREGLLANLTYQNVMTDGFGLAALARLLLSRGDISGAMQTVEKFEAKQNMTRLREFNEEYYCLKARVLLASDLPGAVQWADQVLLSSDYPLLKDYYRHTLARIRLAQGRYAQAEEFPDELPAIITGGNLILRQLEYHLVKAAAIAKQGRLPEALDLLEASLVLAEPEGYVRIFLDIGEPIRELLSACIRSTASGHKQYAQKLLDTFPPSKTAVQPGPVQAGLVEPLSARELEVLQLMAQGMTNQEIARQLIVSPGTVKAHSASIYRKLDAANRTEAVGRARQIGILP